MARSPRQPRTPRTPRTFTYNVEVTAPELHQTKDGVSISIPATHITVPITMTVSAETPPDPPPRGAAQVIVHANDGSQHEFEASAGERLDPFVDPAGDFTQENILCTAPGLPNMRLYYRPDAEGDREEWVFEVGDPWAATPADMPPYSVTITRKSGALVEISVPKHYWFSRWRWQSEPRPVRVLAVELMEAGLLPWLDGDSLCFGPDYTVAEYTPMAMCGIPADQGQTGIYPGIGLITGWQAQYFTRNEHTEGEFLFRNQGEASGSIQQHVRDPNTNAPLNWVSQYPGANMYAAKEGEPYISYPRTSTVDQGHHPSLAYVPALLTGDPYYIEECQFVINQVTLRNPPNSRWSDRGRYFAWPLRSTAQALLVTPETAPSWMLPRAYFTEMLAQQHTLAMKHVNDTVDPWDAVFHDMPDYGQSNTTDPAKTGSHVWQTNYTGLVVSWLSGRSEFTEWRVVAEWLMKNLVARASPTSGYMRAYPSPYHIRYQCAGALAVAMTATDSKFKMLYADTFKAGETVTIDSEQMTLVSTPDNGITWNVTRTAGKAHSLNAFVYGRVFTSWSEVMDSERLRRPDYWKAPSGDTFADGLDLTYPSNQYAALSQAINAKLNVAELAAVHTWFDEQIRARSTAQMRVEDNWAVVKHNQ